MTDKEMEKEITKRTGLPATVVRQVLDVQNQAMRECLVRQEEVVFRSLLRLRATMRKQAVLNPTTKERNVENAIRLSVKPIKAFRKELNRWTSTESS